MSDNLGASMSGTLEPGDRARFFHPGTLGVMLWGCVVEILAEGVRVRFDDPHPTNGKKTFTVPENHLSLRKK